MYQLTDKVNLFDVENLIVDPKLNTFLIDGPN